MTKMSEQSNVVKSTTAVYRQKYQLCKGRSNGTIDLFNTYCCIHNFNWACWHLKVLTIRSKNFIYVLRKFKQHGLSGECTEHSLDNNCRNLTQ